MARDPENAVCREVSRAKSVDEIIEIAEKYARKGQPGNAAFALDHAVMVAKDLDEQHKIIEMSEKYWREYFQTKRWD